jgi:PDDEXK-like domain of unknown function (DUF3799)
VSAPERDGIYSRIPEDMYHGDRDSLSSSGARLLLNTTALEFYYQLQQPPPPRKVFDYGSACHKMVLGEGQQICVVDADNWTTKAAREQRDKAWEQGRAVVLKREMDTAQRMAGELYKHPVAAALLADGQAELSGWWTDPETGVRLRFRPDFIPADVPGRRPLVVDYKTSASANPRKFAKSAADFGYHCQGDWYLEGLAATTGIVDATFVLVVQGKTPPYPVAVFYLDTDDLVRGKSQNRKAIRMYAQCLQTGQWPGYQGITMLSLPTWARRDIDETIEMEG